MSASRLRVRILDDGELTVWSAFCRSSPEGSVYATAEYLDALCAAAGGSFRLLAACRGDEIVGGIPLYERRARGARILAPRLLLYYNSPLLRLATSTYPSKRTAEAVRVLSALAEWIEEAGFGRVTLKLRSTLADARPFLARAWSAFPSYTYVVPLTDLDGAWARMEQNLRRLVKRGREKGLSVTEDDDFESFFALHAATMKRKGQPAYLTPAAFRTYFERLHALGWATLFQARLPDGRAVATELVLLGPFDIAHTVAAAAEPAHDALGSNPLLRWTTFERLSARGVRANDLTDAALNPVTHFKSQLGGNLELCLVVEGPRSLSYRARDAAAGIVRRSRGAAGGVVRRLRGGGAP